MRRCLPVLLSLLSAPARAEGELEKAEQLTIQQLFEVAVRSAPALENAAYSRTQANAQYEAAKGPHDFTVSGLFDFQKTSGAPTLPGLGGNEFTTMQGSVSFKKLLPTNGTIELIGQNTNSTNDILGNVSETITSSLKLRLTQPLLRGIGQASAYKTIDIARYRRNAALVKHSADARVFAVEMIQTYWKLSLAWRKLDIRRASVELGKRQVAFVEAGIRTGKYANAELLPVQQAIVSRQQEILTAELEVVETSIELRRLAGLEVTPDNYPLRTSVLPAPQPLPLDAKTYVAKALAESDDLKVAIAEVASTAAAERGSRRDLGPRVDLRVDGGTIGTDITQRDPTMNPAPIIGNPSFGGSLRALNAGGYSVSGNLTVEYQIGNHNARGVHRADRSNAYHSRVLAATKRADVASEVVRIVYATQVHLKSSELGTLAVSLAEQNVEAETKKFEAGKSSSAEIIRRQDDLEAARLRQAIEQASFQIVLSQLEAAAGIILTKYNVKMLK